MALNDTQKHVVVTGASGFIGSHLVDYLLDAGYRVTALDNYSSGTPKNLSHVDDSNLKTVEHDIRDPLPRFDRVDQIYHLASRASPTDFYAHGIEIAMTNSLGTKNVLDIGVIHDARILVASTSEVYGHPEEHPQTEDYYGNVNPRGPRAVYDESKRLLEALSTAYIRQYNIDTRTIRIFNTYGPRMRVNDGRVIPTFVSQALAGDDLTVHGDGQQTRSFCYVTDLIRGMIAFMETSDLQGEVLNLGNTNEITIKTLAKILIDLTDTKSDIVYEPRPTDDPDLRRPDISRARETLGWTPEVALRDGIAKTIAHFDGSA